MTAVAPLKVEKSFDKSWDFIRKLSFMAGIFVFPNITKKVWLKRISIFSICLGYVIVFLFAYGTFKLNNYNLMAHILCDAILINCAAVFYGFSCMKRRNPEMIGFLDWCRSLYNYREKFHSVQQKIAQKQVDWVFLWGNRLIRGLTAVMLFDSFMISAGFAIVGQFLPETIYPKYSPPMPYYFPIPIEEQQNWKVFLLTTSCQLKSSIDLGALHSLFLSIFYTISIHLYMYLDVIKETIQLMGQTFQAKHGFPELETENELSLKEWIEIIVDMISESNEILSQLGEIFTGYFFLFELASFGSLFIFGMIILVLHQQYFFAFGIVGAAAILFSFCFINEQLLKKFKEISDAFYEFPWYTLTPHERKLYRQMMASSHITRGFRASGIHDVTFERFSKIVQAAYSNVLVLKDLVMKF